MKSAEEMAAEMVPEPVPFLNEWQVRLGDCGLGTSIMKESMVQYAEDVRNEIVALITRERAAAYAAGRADGAVEGRAEVATALEELAEEWPGAAGAAMIKAARKIRTW